MTLHSLTTLLLDGDGVLWRGDTAVPGLQRFFEQLRERGIRWALLTNNNTNTVDGYVRKLAGFGISASRQQIVTSSTVTAAYLLDRHGPGAAVHAVGMSGLLDTLREAGFKVSTGEQMPDHDVVAVAAGMDRELTVAKVKVAMRLILSGADFVATNTDGTYPAPDGLSPGTGMVIGALQFTSGVKPTVMAKPESAMYEVALRALGAERETTAMVGDRLSTDILGAHRADLRTIAVLTGVNTAEDFANSPVQPDWVFDGIWEIFNNQRKTEEQ